MSDGRQPSDESDGATSNSGGGAIHTPQIDLGVAVAGGLVCQNFESHPDEEVKMIDGPFDGVMCPECGRMSGASEEEIPYWDPREEGSA